MSKHSELKTSTLNSPRNVKKKSNSPFNELQESKLKKQWNRLKLINRIELDRPILFAGKMDVLWTKPTEILPEINIVRYKIEVSLYW